jgi:polysaccharide pyruvyl transferase WcaK-like protein
MAEKKRKERRLRKKADAIIIGGGEILTEENRNSYWYRLASILPCWFKKIPIYLMGGIQVPRKNINKSLFKLLLNKTKKIFARDFESINELKAFGFDNVEFFMDTAFFSYDRKKIKNEELKMKNEGKKYIIVNVNKNGERFFDAIFQDVKAYIQQ